MNADTLIAIEKLKDLIQKEGVFYALLFSLFEDSHILVSKLDDYDPNQRISSDESHWLIGFMIQYNSSFLDSFPKDLTDFISLGKEIHDVLKELEYSYAKSFSLSMEDVDSPNNILAALSVAIHYDGNSAYDLEYADFAIKRYEGIRSWLKENMNIDIYDCTCIANNIKSLLMQKGCQVRLFSEDELQLLCGHKPSEDETNQFRVLQFLDLYDEEIYSDDDAVKQQAIKRFCLRLLDLFCFSKEDINKELYIDEFLDKFSCDYANNQIDNTRFDQPGKYNILDSNPIIKVKENQYFVPYILNVFKSIYESPYYWWMDANKQHSKEAGEIIGKAHETIVFNLLKNVFGKQCWQGVILQKGKNEITDIDVLCIIGSKAICIQVKSKKLSEKSKTGECEALKNDFEKSIGASYKQAEKCKTYLMGSNVEYYQKDEQNVKRQIEIPTQDVTDIYLMCILCGEYDGLAHHVDYLFKPQEQAPLPLICSIFDLHLLTEYLRNPYDFTYYVKQRIETWKFFKFTNEISILGYHLKNNLHHLQGYNVALIDDDYARAIDKDYMPYLYGKKNKLDLSLMWRSGFIDQFCSLLQEPKFIDVLFLINDFSSDTFLQFEEKVRESIEKSSTNHSMAATSMTFDEPSVGLTVCAASDEYKMEDLFLYSEGIANKYLKEFDYRFNKWYILGISSSKAHVYFLNVLSKQCCDSSFQD